MKKKNLKAGNFSSNENNHDGDLTIYSFLNYHVNTKFYLIYIFQYLLLYEVVIFVRLYIYDRSCFCS